MGKITHTYKQKTLSVIDREGFYLHILLHKLLRIGEGIDLHLALLDERFAEGDGQFVVAAAAKIKSHPHSAKHRAISRPIPPDAPVINTYIRFPPSCHFFFTYCIIRRFTTQGEFGRQIEKDKCRKPILRCLNDFCKRHGYLCD